MENKTIDSGQGKFFNGFLLGLLVGGFLVFVLGTKKGKRLLKVISEEGLDNISNILEEADKTEDLDDVNEEKKDALKRKVIIKKKSVEEKTKPRRFFRGISRHLN